MTHASQHPATIAVTAGRPAAEPDQPLNAQIMLASSFVAGGDLEYARFQNPTWTALEDAIGGLEGGRALAFASGMAAVAAVLDQVPHGGRVVVPRHAYQGSLGLLEQHRLAGRVEPVLVDVEDADAVIAAIEGAALVWLETPTNPALEVADVPRVVQAAKAAGVPVAVDNTFATPLLQRPLDDGADVVVHSATKLMSGHSDVILGAVVTRDDAWHERLHANRSLHGAIPGPFEAFLVLRGLRTLDVRLERAQANARAVVAALEAHPAVVRVRYPGFSTVVSFELPSAEAADRVVASVRLARHATSLGGVETTLERRRRWASESKSIPEGLVRLSVGIEHGDDIVADLLQALDA
ncbi:trans-sulfuration enzyme family protein [Agrococcus sp. SGAir0287]|uniref:trans-sulfuration enzyme family protein n=1 Tax=Agrococcus sp. SGAir0287 TaxID=2070347 RepID=UPI0010CD01A1|nr:PLP-dependent transferase [Agrococcus sp. SGAir0287]QCR19196.1 cystathionine gamma-synthase [Agrococcus sp. SGAir0287]